MIENNTIISKIKEIYDLLHINEQEHCGLLGGLSGKLLFILEYEKMFYDTAVMSKTQDFLEQLLFQIQNGNDAPHYSFGLSGANMVLKKIVTDEILDEESTQTLKFFTTQIDNLCIAYLKSESLTNHTDFLHGELGILWGINSFNREKFDIQNYIQELISVTQLSQNGYFTCFNKLQEETMISLGISHGGPAALAILSKLLVKNQKNIQTCERIKSYIGSKRNLDNNNICLYPSFITTEKESNYSRLAWCYGDLGIGIAFWQAGKALNREDWKQEAIDIFLHSSKRRNLEENGVNDAGLCHGTAGIAHVFNRMYWETKNPVFKETANYWIEETLKMAKFEYGLAGFKSWFGEEEGWRNDYCFLEGIAGIGLALLAHISDEEPTWDKCLLLS